MMSYVQDSLWRPTRMAQGVDIRGAIKLDRTSKETGVSLAPGPFFIICMVCNRLTVVHMVQKIT